MSDNESVSASVVTFQELANEAGIRRVLQLLRERLPSLEPTHLRASHGTSVLDFGPGPTVELTEEALADAVRRIQQPMGGLLELTREGSPSVLLVFSRHSPRGFDFMSLFFDRARLDVPAWRAEFSNVATGLFDGGRGFYGSLGTTSTTYYAEDESGSRYQPADDWARGLPPPTWGIYLGPEYVELIGRRRVQSAPCEVVRHTARGGILLLLAEDPGVLERSPEILSARRDSLQRHFGHEYFSHLQSEVRRVLPQFRHEVDLVPDSS